MAADSEDCFRSIEVFWTKDATDTEDNTMAYVPGILEPGNRRPTKITARKMREVKAAIPRKQPKVEDLPVCGDEPPMRDKMKIRNTTNNNSGNNSKEIDWTDRCKKASLKDLCNEDKKRIADLIRELARVGDEKEGALKQLKQERHEFEKHITDILGQQESLLKERENVQTQLLACQALLMRYQELVTEQQDKVSVVSSEATTKRTEDKAVNSSFVLSSPRSDCATSERKAELYSPQKSSRPTSAKSYDEDSEKKGAVKPASHLEPTGYGMPLNPRSRDTDHPPYSCQQRAPPPFVSAPPITSDPTGRCLMPCPQHNCYCPYHNLEQVHSFPMQVCYPITIAPPTSDMPRHSGALPEQRPFTKVIDQEIAKEKQCARPVSEDQLFGVGPLPMPTMSSTQRSDYGSVVAGHCGATDGANFEPLRPESAQSSTLDGKGGVPGGATILPENLPEDEFIRYYQQLTPAERKRQLQTQKAALLKEQQYLRKVLSEQERLLSSKQEQLHKQQSVQRQRLEYFEQNGHFPSLPLDSSTMSGANETPSSCTRPETTDCEERADDLVRRRLEELRLQERVALPVTSFRNMKSASTEMYSSSKRSTVTSPRVRRTVSVATSPIRSPDLRRERQGKRQTRHTACDRENAVCRETLRSSLKTGKRGCTRRGVPTRITPKQLSVSLPVCDDSVTSLLDIVDEVESLHNYSTNGTSPTKQHTQSPGNISLTARQPNTSWSESDSLEESRVLEDVFFVK